MSTATRTARPAARTAAPTRRTAPKREAAPKRQAAPSRVPQPRQRPASPATRSAPATRVAARPRSRTRVTAIRRSTLLFVVFASSLIGVMILGLVAMNALLAQSSFKVDDLQSRVDRLTRISQQRSLEAARLASPERIATEARNLGLGLPQDGIQVLHVPTSSPAHGGRKAVGGRP